MITFALGLFVLIGMVGLAVDIGRMYIAKSESQTFVDSASLAATLELDGTQDGLSRARTRVASNPNRWNFNTSTFSTVTTSFAQSVSGPWEETPLNATGYRYARATARIAVPVYFMPTFQSGTAVANTAFIQASPSFTSNVAADSAGGQELKTRFKDGLFPFSPYAHNTTAPDFGLAVGQLYTIRWPANPRLNQNTCPGDNQQAMIDLAEAGGGSERGYIEETSADVIRKAIVGDYQTIWRGVGDSVIMTGGAKQAQLTELINRINMDWNTSSPNYASYVATGTGNGRRMIGVPINTGHPNYTVVQIAAFFLQKADTYENGGNKPWCAEYVGAWVQGSSHRGAGDPGSYVVRLVK